MKQGQYSFIFPLQVSQTLHLLFYVTHTLQYTVSLACVWFLSFEKPRTLLAGPVGPSSESLDPACLLHVHYRLLRLMTHSGRSQKIYRVKQHRATPCQTDNRGVLEFWPLEAVQYSFADWLPYWLGGPCTYFPITSVPAWSPVRNLTDLEADLGRR